VTHPDRDPRTATTPHTPRGPADASTQPTADLIRAAIADAVTICNAPLIDHAASGVLYALGLVEIPPADGAPGPAARRSCFEERFGHAPNCPVDQPAPDGTAASSGTPDDQLRERYTAAIDAVTGGTCQADIIDAVLAVRDRRMDQLAAERDMLGRDVDRLRRDWTTMRTRAETADATLARVEALADHYPVAIDTAHLHAALDTTPAPCTHPRPDRNGLGVRYCTDCCAPLDEPVYDAVRDGHHDLDGEQS
jgi:hypothetical protein